MVLKKVKLHLGCGSVYLKGYTNIDLTSTKNLKDKKSNMTNLNSYYKRLYTRDLVRRPIYADFCIDIRFLNFYYDPCSVDEILAIQVLEHFPKEDVNNVLKRWYNVLKKGGKIYVDVPDIGKTLRQAHYYFDYTENEEDLEYNLRLIFGSGKDENARHYDGYYPLKLERMFKKVGFKDLKFVNKVGHSYPAFGLEARK